MSLDERERGCNEADWATTPAGRSARYAQSMEFVEVLRRRRMVRNYDPAKPVSRASLERIAAAAQRADDLDRSDG